MLYMYNKRKFLFWFLQNIEHYRLLWRPGTISQFSPNDILMQREASLRLSGFPCHQDNQEIIWQIVTDVPAQLLG